MQSEGMVASELDGSPSLVVVHSYVPGAVKLAQAHLQPTQVGVWLCTSAAIDCWCCCGFEVRSACQHAACCVRKRVKLGGV
jgi:hypothetical protein